ncbi:MAG: hypothetical protein U1E30_03150 [Rhodoblastus sp.]
MLDGAFAIEGGSLECRASVGVALAPPTAPRLQLDQPRRFGALCRQRERNGAFHLFAHGGNQEVSDRAPR